jgi:hypothetical protein
VVEAGEQLGAPGEEGAAVPGELDDRAGPQVGDQLAGLAWSATKCPSQTAGRRGTTSSANCCQLMSYVHVATGNKNLNELRTLFLPAVAGRSVYCRRSQYQGHPVIFYPFGTLSAAKHHWIPTLTPSLCGGTSGTPLWADGMPAPRRSPSDTNRGGVQVAGVSSGSGRRARASGMGEELTA